ncbi:glutamate receptor ionotropic, delta-2-like [Cimex lectularius]|uniref:Ionotropic glutamate receptor L-glutamate and glycine-binding domain-containing protein n=1 Tax=Cimex lectularius TaxID=79782 RepID=A0A8I6RDS4_CIMLE|nr:glutamate receptor ionotropic, delta-2-like [Cimex lectularius]
MKFVALTFVLICGTCKSQLPDLTPEILKHFFREMPGSNFYFCNGKDAVRTTKAFVGQYNFVSTRLLQSVQSNKEIKITMDLTPQRIGVFLDLTCNEGYDFLESSLGLFNMTYRWLIWTWDINETLISLRSSRVILDSDVTLATHGVKFYDLYRIHETSDFIITEIGLWTDEGHSFDEKPKRTDFRQFVFNASLMMVDIQFNLSNLIPPLLDKSYEPGKDMVRRFGLSLFMHISEFYNFRMSYVLSNAWGDPLKNGTWTGMVGQVKRGESDFGLAPAKYVMERYNVIDFVTSLHIVRACFTFLQPKLFGTYKALVLPLDACVWGCLGIFMLLGVLAFKAVSRHDKTSVCNENLGGSILLVLSSFSQQGFPDNSYMLSTRIIYLSLLLVTFFVAAYYNTAILNGLLLQAPNAIQNVEQLLDSDVNLGVLDAPYFRNEIQTLNDSLTLRTRKKLEKAKQVYFNVADGVLKIKKGQFALFTEDEALYTEIMLKMSDAEICSLSEVEKYKPFHVGAIARDNSAYKEMFNRAFALIRERGLMNRQKNYWIVEKPECHWKQDALSLDLEPMALAYFILILGFILAFTAYWFERWVHKKEKKSLEIKMLY